MDNSPNPVTCHHLDGISSIFTMSLCQLAKLPRFLAVTDSEMPTALIIGACADIWNSI